MDNVVVLGSGLESNMDSILSTSRSILSLNEPKLAIKPQPSEIDDLPLGANAVIGASIENLDTAEI